MEFRVKVGEKKTRKGEGTSPATLSAWNRTEPHSGFCANKKLIIHTSSCGEQRKIKHWVTKSLLSSSEVGKCLGQEVAGRCKGHSRSSPEPEGFGVLGRGMGWMVQSAWLHPRTVQHLLQDVKTWLTWVISQGTGQSFGLRSDFGPKKKRDQF